MLNGCSARAPTHRLPSGSVIKTGISAEADRQCKLLGTEILVEPRILAKLDALRGSGETYGDVIPKESLHEPLEVE